ncbi:GCN5 family acetyltransferase [Ruegeria sp. ANG-R]|uniref:GNAT family N-acetyltransferase n=1 Tax=Ruegeria sp. ANG-R TaxID=1577903 RepID=UPI00057C3920|nr:GNAT family N-acetyltransferase [Ruegeria sp. ANG-R]KIC39984.1 GCN5 family acetyltransferase [Ruegeria sp. ANG-R]
MTIRPARRSDAASLAALSIEVWVGTYLRQGVNAFFADYVLSEYTKVGFEALIADPDQYVMVSENADGIDGFLRLTKGSPAPITGLSGSEISTLYVQPRHHGKGIGKALLQIAKDYCRTYDEPSVWLTTNSENIPAIRFYLSQGFRQVGVTEFRIQDRSYPNHVLSLVVDPLPL